MPRVVRHRTPTRPDQPPKLDPAPKPRRARRVAGASRPARRARGAPEEQRDGRDDHRPGSARAGRSFTRGRAQSRQIGKRSGCVRRSALPDERELVRPLAIELTPTPVPRLVSAMDSQVRLIRGTWGD